MIPSCSAPTGAVCRSTNSNARGSVQGYVEQVAYADRIIADLVGALQDRPSPPVILVQADEGPYPIRDYDIPWQDASAEELSTKSGILNAYYFPDGDYRSLYPGISPINSYRVLFNKYLGFDLPILPDRIFAFPNDLDLYNFHDVTDRVRSGAPARVDAGATPTGATAPQVR